MQTTATTAETQPAQSQFAIEFRNVTFAYEDRVILNDISFGVRRGELKCVLGGSGSGKSTILRLAMRLIEPDEGQIIVDGIDISHLREEELTEVRRHMGVIFQGGALFDSLTVRENVGYRLIEQHWPEDKIEEEVRRQLDFLGFTDDLDALPAGLSGGSRRTVAIARALAGGPGILLYDEPTTGLDPATAKTVCELAARLRDTRNVSSIFVTHRLDDIRYLSSQLYLESGLLQRDGTNFCLSNQTFMILRNGQVYFNGPEEKLRTTNDEYLREFLGEIEDEED